jgi:serine/threonine-protein kinase
MPDRESDLLFGLLALELGFVTREQLLECVALWTGEAEGTLRALLAKKARLREDQARAVQGLVEARVARSVAERTRVASRGGETGTEAPPAVRYRLGGEIGRGGLGRVIEAHDAALDRAVALKLALEDLPADLAERFVREARLAARLEHPAIVPVYDFGTLPGPEGRARVYLAMKRIRGRNLEEVLRAVASGDAEARRAWTRGRLLRVFQDVCLGMQFAHDRGVIHRDLKPANVMIGDYGETMIVDWGLAREAGVAERRGGSSVPGRGEEGCPALTLEGDVLGTPAYMSPEQASGRRDAVDARSDVYSLGAILYEILTLHPPVEGASVEDILSLVRSGRIVTPSQRVRAEAASRGAAESRAAGISSTDAAGCSVPSELEAACMRALAVRPEDRFPSARALHDDIALFLEGVRQRERERAGAEEEIGRAREAAERHARLRTEAAAALARARVLGRAARAHEAKDELWATEDRAARLEAEAVEAFAAADGALTLALGHVRDHAEARRLKAELWWTRVLEAEESGREADVRFARRVVEQFNDGAFDALLKGDGALEVSARRYPCRCLLEGRSVLPEELNYRGYHPMSGRALDGRRGAEGLPGLEPRGATMLRVHGPGCRTAPVEGADVWLWRFVEEGRLLVPATPEGPAGPDGSAAAAAAFEPGSPYRPRGPGLWLGRTPVPRSPVPMGSYLLIVAREGFAPLRVPVWVGRCASVAVEPTLFLPDELPEGFVAVAGGPFTWQGDRAIDSSPPARRLDASDVFISRHPVTAAAYAAFLNALPAGDARRHAPRELEGGESFWPGPPWAVPTAEWLAAAPAGLRERARRLTNVPLDWREDWPALGISWEDSVAFCAARTRATGRLFTLPHEVDWEKSARGPDRRVFPMGARIDGRWTNNNHSFPEGPRPCPVQDFPHDESPYGVRGLSGNSHDFALNDPGADMAAWRVHRGGYYTHSGDNSRATARTGFAPRMPAPVNGIRPACLVRLPQSDPVDLG